MYEREAEERGGWREKNEGEGKAESATDSGEHAADTQKKREEPKKKKENLL